MLPKAQGGGGLADGVEPGRHAELHAVLQRNGVTPTYYYYYYYYYYL